jgi:Holliday junction DNA helicase RuvA
VLGGGEGREEEIHGYGRGEREERDWFRLRGTVQGGGARHELAILSVLSPDDLAQAVAAQDKQAIARANAVGPKLAGRIAAELKDKAGQLAGTAVEAPAGSAAALGGAAPESDDGARISEDAVSALTNLGYRRTDAFGAVATATRRLGRAASLEALITEGLKELSQ